MVLSKLHNFFNPNTQVYKRRTSFLGIMAIFKNEGHAIQEWIRHYESQGVEYFYLIDNGSTDSYKENILEEMSRLPIHIVHFPGRHLQVNAYRKVYRRVRRQCEWLIIADLDEFIYARRGYGKISDFLSTLGSDIASVNIPWKMFGSSGHISQPASIIQSFTHRWSFQERSRYRSYSDKIFCKSIIRNSYISEVSVHVSRISKGKALGPDMRDSDNSDQMKVSESLLTNSFLHLNHYPIQSLEFFLSVKSTRGDAGLKSLDKVRDFAYFKNYDQNEVLDTELAELIHCQHVL